MKKKLLTELAIGLFLIGMAGMANATTVGHDVLDRANVDSWSSFSMIDYDMQLTDAGQINSWSIYAERVGGIYLQTFRLVSGSAYEVVGENYFDVTIGVNNFTVAAANKINYQANDYIGWTFTDPAILSFDYEAGGSVDWAPGNGQSALGLGSTMTFDSSQERVYSISAETAHATPEPATMLLFGTGLAGLAGSRLRRKKK